MSGLGEAAFDRRLVLPRPRPQPLEQGVLARGEHEDAECLGHRLTHLRGALDVDVEHDEAAPGQLLLDRFARRAVPGSTEDLGVFEEATGLDPGEEGGLVDEVVVATVDLPDERGRVVAEMLKTPPYRSRRRWTSVVLPAPDGPLMTSSSPRPSVPGSESSCDMQIIAG